MCDAGRIRHIEAQSLVAGMRRRLRRLPAKGTWAGTLYDGAAEKVTLFGEEIAVDAIFTAFAA
jgi:hypothetical protein